jgi:hypothetical protein
VLQRGVEPEDVLAGGALLRPEDVARAVQAGQRIVDVGGRDQADRAQLGRTGQFVRGDQRAAAVGQCIPGHVHRAGAERGEHARAAVVGGRAAQPHDHLPRAGLGGRGDQQAEAVGGGPVRVAFGLGQQVQTAGLRALHVRGAAADEDLAVDRAAERVDRRHRDAAAVDDGGEHVDEARAAVGERSQHGLVARCDLVPTLAQRLGGGRRGKCAGELVGAYQYAHAVTVQAPHSYEWHGGPMTLLQRLQRFLRSPQGQRIVDQGRRQAAKPENQARARKLLSRFQGRRRY